MWAAVVVATVSAVATNVQRIDAEQDAEIQAREDKERALKAQEFAEKEGEGVGSLGRISLGIDNTLDDDIRKSGQSNISI